MSGMTKAELAEANKITREVKEEEQIVKDTAKETVDSAKKSAKALAHKTEDLSIQDAPDRLLPSAKQIDQKLADAKDSIQDFKSAQHGDVNLQSYPKIQQVLSDTQKVLEDNRALLKDKSEDKTIRKTIQHTANLAQTVYDGSWVTLDKLWSNWASLLTVVAAGSAGSWKNILEQGTHLINDLRHTQDFIKLVNDLQTCFFAISERATKTQPAGEKLEELNQEWEKQRDQLMGDLQKVWGQLSASPIWKQLLAQGKALKAEAAKVGGETKAELTKVKDQALESSDAKKLKEDFKGILQLAVGKNGPDVQPFLTYASAAWSEIVTDDMYAQWADEMSTLFDSAFADPKKMDEEAYKKQYDALYKQTKELLDSTVRNENLRLALRESKKLMKAAKADPATKKLINDATKLVQHLSDKKGVNLMSPQLLDEIRAVVVPLLVDHFDNAPLPDYHGHDENALGKYNFSLSGIRLGTTGLIPSKVKVEFRYRAEANPRQLEVTQQHMYMYLEIDDIQVAFKDVKWNYERLTIPRFNDHGTVDIATAGKGIQLRLKAEIHNYHAPEHAHSLGELLEPPKDFKMFTILRSECVIDDFHINVSEAGGASVFYEMLAGIWGTKIKHQIEHQVEAKMNILADRFDRTLYDIVRRSTQPTLAEEAKATLLAAGHSAGDKITEITDKVKEGVQSL